MVAAEFQALLDAAVDAIVVRSEGRAFVAGADIKEFGKPTALQEPNLISVIGVLENSTKPVVAAIHTVAMGGGRWIWEPDTTVLPL